MRSRTFKAAVVGSALAGALLFGGCSVSVGNVTKVPEYVEVEAQGVRLEVLDGMVESDVPVGFDAFWQNHDGGALVSVAVATFVDESTFVDDQVASLGEAMPDITTSDAGGGAVAFEGTGVDDSTYTGLIAVRDGIGVVVSAGEGVADAVVGHVVESVQATEGEATSEDEAASDDEAASGELADDGPVTTTVFTADDSVMVDVLEGMAEYPSDAYDGLWQTPAGTSPQVTVSVSADVDPATYLQEQATAISSSMQNPVELDETEDRYVFSGTGVDGQEYTVVVGVNGSVGVVASSGPGLDVEVLHDLVDSAW
ncbi:hypothetical protein Xcel_0500 [Xylanimonas cellulosilytica DSM 15894]|uniref:Uncharacterized protein n=1 Tax=Xylanimonas cellulosilytica (strain DSM 15894 / JCM 12276 / CECT 5975 / KCTC 9989 / LMG 20990 / NBRC 107835 / XIL07) TaxID=446471 RepID=D1BW36_XYLCX|nr:hypothetical protein [Xylanimonas cellulosilytica]ACZ29539.1 hypothetical protein Xcel_0500 [Xylanimonas cellulosilytica DSM 15894]